MLNKMWESPIYKVKAKLGGNEKDILIDVTGSAPNFKETMKILLKYKANYIVAIPLSIIRTEK